MVKFKSLVTAAALLLTLSASANDRFYIDPVDLTPGEVNQLVFCLDNSQEYVGFQAEMVLPDGITIKNFTLSERANGTLPSLNYNVLDNVVKILEASENHTPFTGSEGPLLYANINVDDQFAGGELTLRNIYFSNTSDDETEMKDYSVDLGVSVNLFYLPDFTIKSGEKKTVAFVLDNSTPFCAFQTDIYMPSGLTIVPGSFTISDRATGSVNSSSFEGGRTRVTFRSNEAFTGNEGELLSFEVEASADAEGILEINIKNSLFSTPDANEYTLENTTTMVTIDKTTGIPSEGIEGLTIYTTGNTIYVGGVSKGTILKLYSIDGKIIDSKVYNDSIVNFIINQSCVYILKADSTTRKIAL